MIRQNNPKTNKVVVDTSQFSIDSAHLSSEQQLAKMEEERAMLAARMSEIKLKLSLCPVRNGGRNHTTRLKRLELTQEYDEIVMRLTQIKPDLKKLNVELNAKKPDRTEILLEILDVLKQIAKQQSTGGGH